MRLSLCVVSLVFTVVLLLLCSWSLALPPRDHRHNRVRPPAVPAVPPVPAAPAAPATPAVSTLRDSRPRSQSGRVLGVNDLSNVDASVDCGLKTFAAQFASYLQPLGWPHASNWSREVVEAMQLTSLCNVTADTIAPPPYTRPSTLPAGASVSPSSSASPAANCAWTRYVDGVNGNNSNDGSLNAPWREIIYAVAQSRTRYTTAVVACIYIRAGVHYFGDHQEHMGAMYESQLGAIALTAQDSNLTISAYNGERVVFSGGVPLSLQWSVYKSTPAGNIMQAKIPANVAVGWDQFNELYFDDWRAVRAKFPNGDPFLVGRFSNPTGYVDGAASWIGNDKTIPAAAEIHVSEPAPDSIYFPQFQIGIEGTVSNFDPPHSYWALANPPGGGGSTYVITRGFVWNERFSGRAATWANPTTGRIFAFHCGSWGSWQFAIASTDPASQTIRFGDGGWQEARGCDHGSDMYVHNIFEELDDINEYFVDTNTRTIYFLPNGSIPTDIIASQIPCIISMHGTATSPVYGVTISGISFTQTSNSFLRKYEAPSGGDYSIHRGGAVYLQGTAFTSILGNSFTQLGSNALVVSKYNLNTTIALNEFRWLGESAIILAGESDGIDGVSNRNQPTYTHIESNLGRDFSIYVKQGDFIFETMARSSVWAANLGYNAPRSIFNKNDGFAGGLDAYQNLLFNANKETGDHGPVNTWDRQPYLTEENGQGPSLVPKTNTFHSNFLINDWGSDMSIDHDDGSAYYYDAYNFFMYSGTKNYLGHSKVNNHQLFVYSDVHPGYGFPGCQCDFTDHNYDSAWTNSKCILLAQTVPYNIQYCNPGNTTNIPPHHGNQFYVPRQNRTQFQCGSETLSLLQWQRLGMDAGSAEAATPEVDTVVAWGQQVLYLPNGYSVQTELDW